jgi:hypothetical protein
MTSNIPTQPIFNILYQQNTKSPLLRKEKEDYAGVITPQACIKEAETLLSESEVLTLLGGFEPATPKSLA